MHRKVFLVVLLVTMLLATGLANAQTKTLVIGMSQEPEAFGPLFTMVAGTTVEGAMMSALIRRDHNWDLHPEMALYRPSTVDGTWIVDEAAETMIVHWKIRDDITWHDGAPFTVHDFILGWKAILTEGVPAPTTAWASRVEKIEVISDFEAKVYWKELMPFADITFAGADPLPSHILGPVLERAIETGEFDPFNNHATWSSEWIGTGPYKMVEWVYGSHIELARNENWFGPRPIIDRVFFRFITDMESLRIAIQRGEVDASLPPTLSFDSAMQLRSQTDPSKITVNFTPGTVWEHIDLNVRDFAPFQDIRVRRALLHGIDRQEISDTVFGGAYFVAHAYMTPNHPLWTDAASDVMTFYEYNPEKARELLAEAGFAPDAQGIMTHRQTGEKLILNFRTTAGNQPRELVQLAIAEQWKQIGVGVQIENMTALFERMHFYSKQWPHLILFAWSSPPTSLGDSLWHSKFIPTEANNWVGQNIPEYNNPRVDELLDEMMGTMNETRRQALAVEILQHWTYDLPSIPLFFRVQENIWHTYVTGIRPIGTSDPNTWNIHEWDINK